MMENEELCIRRYLAVVHHFSFLICLLLQDFTYIIMYLLGDLIVCVRAVSTTLDFFLFSLETRNKGSNIMLVNCSMLGLFLEVNSVNEMVRY